MSPCKSIALHVKHCLDFSFVFSAPLPAWRNEETYLFSASGIFYSGRYQRAVLGSSVQQKVPASLSLFLKVKKKRNLLYLRKGPEYRPFGAFQPVTLAYRPWAQISNHGKASPILKNPTLGISVVYIWRPHYPAYFVSFLLGGPFWYSAFWYFKKKNTSHYFSYFPWYLASTNASITRKWRKENDGEFYLW